MAADETFGLIVDGHTHVWPDAIAAKALSAVPDLDRVGDGTLAGLDAAMTAAGVDRAVCLGVAPTALTVDAANRFLGGLDRERYIGFGSVHPDLTPEENVASLRANGLRGAKLHPIFQNYRLDDSRVLEVLDALRGEFVAIVHVGAGGAPGDTERCTPSMIRDIARALPDLILVACHFGGFKLLEEAAEIVIGTPILVDTAWPPTLGDVDPGRLRDLIRRHGPERVIFASDWPMADIGREVHAIRSLGLGETELDAVLGGTLARVLSL